MNRSSRAGFTLPDEIAATRTLKPARANFMLPEAHVVAPPGANPAQRPAATIDPPDKSSRAGFTLPNEIAATRTQKPARAKLTLPEAHVATLPGAKPAQRPAATIYPPDKSSRAGFTLLEVLVATVIMGIAVTTLIVGLSQSVKNASRLADYDRAVMLANTKMNDLILDVNLPFDGSVDGDFAPEQSGGVQSGWRASLKPYDVPPNAGPGTVVLQEIALEVWWEPASGSRRTMQLQSYRQAPIPIPLTPAGINQ